MQVMKNQLINELTFALSSNMLSPTQPEMGTKATDLGLYPIFLMYAETSF